MTNCRRSAMIAGCSLLSLAPAFGGSMNVFAPKPDFPQHLVDAVGTPPNKNVLLSPFSAQVALSMVLPGMEGADKKLLSDVVSLSPGQIKGLSHGHPELAVANSVWVDSRIKLEPGYATQVHSDFGASVFPFTHDATSLHKINAWVSTNTKQRIPKILDGLKEADRVILINAIAFDGVWAKQFEKSNTRDQDFHSISGTMKQVPMMHMKQSVPYISNESLKAIRLNYQGDAFSMLVMLPEKDKDAGKLLRSLSSSQMNNLISSMSEGDKVEIALPKFKYSDSHQLAGPLTSMGLGKLFNDADFSKMSSALKRGRIDRVIQKTYIEVDEKGTKAAAATGAIMQPTMVRANPPTFIADRPFAFLILDNASHVVLFSGVVNQP